MSIHARKSIMTKYLGATNTRPSRIKATSARFSVMISYDDGLNQINNHAEAAAALARKMKWAGEWHVGGSHDERGFVFVNVEEDTKAFTIDKA